MLKSDNEKVEIKFPCKLRMTVLQFQREVSSMKTSWKIKKRICILLALFYVTLGMCFDTVETDSLFDYTVNGNRTGIETFVSNNRKGVSLVGSETLNFSTLEVTYQNRERTARGRFCQGFLIMAFAALFLRIAYECRRLLGLSDVMPTSGTKNVICYIHKQDGKKEIPVFF